MIEFNGYLTGFAEKHFFRKSRILGQNILLVSSFIILPAIVSVAIRIQNWTPILIWLFAFAGIPLIVMIPKGKKEKIQITPKRIYVEDEYIVCVADRYTESRLVSEVKTVRDFGEFYEMIFPFGRISDKFICQKSLLTKGSIQDFEALFSGKIVNKTEDGSVC